MKNYVVIFWGKGRNHIVKLLQDLFLASSLRAAGENGLEGPRFSHWFQNVPYVPKQYNIPVKILQQIS